MQKTDKQYITCLEILKEELVPAMGCTEPVALAFAAAKAREVLGRQPERVLVELSGNIVKNVKSVVVPNTGGLKGIKAAVTAGIVAGDAEKKLEVIEKISAVQQRLITEFLEKTPIEIKMADTGRVLEIVITLFAASSRARLRIIDSHTNIVLIEKDGETIFEKETEKNELCEETGRTALDVKTIIDFAETVAIEDVISLIERQIEYNSAISSEGLKGNYGANIGKVLLKTSRDDIRTKAKAAAAAGSDARMSGCSMPVIILSGSGNQGMTASLPVIEYSSWLKKSRDELIRALVLSDLITVHLKTGIGRLSAYCGAVSAGAAAGAAICYLQGGQFEEISHTLINALAITSGIICDGAKPSCAAKIAAAVDAGILGGEMLKEGQRFCGGDGIIAAEVENTIKNISRLGREGMRATDREIIRIMLEET
jgi:L-cysteine desulfidase